MNKWAGLVTDLPILFLMLLVLIKIDFLHPERISNDSFIKTNSQFHILPE